MSRYKKETCYQMHGFPEKTLNLKKHFMSLFPNIPNQTNSDYLEEQTTDLVMNIGKDGLITNMSINNLMIK